MSSLLLCTDVEQLAKEKPLVTILFDRSSSDYQEFVDLCINYASQLQDKVSTL